MEYNIWYHHGEKDVAGSSRVEISNLHEVDEINDLEEADKMVNMQDIDESMENVNDIDVDVEENDLCE